MKMYSKKYLNFAKERNQRISKYSSDFEWKKLTNRWLVKAFKNKYINNFESLGRPIIQTPIDIIAVHELIWQIKPDLIIETGIAHGGSLISSASMLAILDMCDAIDLGKNFNPKKSNRKVLGIDIEIRAHNKKAIEKHPMSSRIEMIEGSSISDKIVKAVHDYAKNYKNVLVLLDSNHTYNHVFAELNSYASLTSIGSYCIVFDTIVDDVPKYLFRDRPWGPKNNPKTAIKDFLKNNSNFKVDKNIQNKLLLTVAPNGYLKRIK